MYGLFFLQKSEKIEGKNKLYSLSTMLKDLGINTKHNVHRLTLNLHSLKIMMVDSLSLNISCWGAVVFEKWVKQCYESMFYMLK